MVYGYTGRQIQPSKVILGNKKQTKLPGFFSAKMSAVASWFEPVEHSKLTYV